jgi:uncharacterized protein (TIGR03083 family)
MRTPPSAQLAGETRAERERLAALFGGLSPEQWSAPSLCEGWRVREAAAHITMPFRTGPLGYMAGLVLAGFSFNRYADQDARSTAHERSQAELVDLLRRNLDNPWQPPRDGGAGAGALSHDVIHGLDVTEPLGLPASPADRIGLVLGSMKSWQLRYFGVDLEGQRLTATDADVSVGAGPRVVPMTAKQILLTVTGRRTLARQSSEGEEATSEPVRRPAGKRSRVRDQ